MSGWRGLEGPQFDDGQPLCTEVDTGDLFFPPKGGSTREAKAICSRCDVQAACLQWALDNDERHGIWGGLSERERRLLRRRPRPSTGRAA